jgi:hypothetical protein
MARAIELIERDIAALKATAQIISDKLQIQEASYMSALGQALRGQLILATYQLCTQGYPEKFLSLSLKARQELQQAIRKLSQKGSEQLLLLLKSEKEGDGLNEDDELDEGIEDELDEDDEDDDDQLDEDDEDEEDEEDDEDDDQLDEDDEDDKLDEDDELSEYDEGDIEAFEAAFIKAQQAVEQGERDEDWEESELQKFNLGDKDKFPLSLISSVAEFYSSATPDFSNPVELLRWQQYIESQIKKILKNLSHQANVTCQKAGILPKKLPRKILEMASSSDSPVEMMPGPPNLLNLVIEIENGQQSQDSKLTQIMAISLRLGEIEFADTTLSSHRNQIRNILAKLSKLAREYQKKQRELAIAEAEAAWRASWYEE